MLKQCSRLTAIGGLFCILLLTVFTAGQEERDPLPSWNDGPRKKALLEFVRVTTTDKTSPKFVPVEERIATFDLDGTLWVEQPMYTQVVFMLDRVAELAPKRPEWKTTEPFKTILAGDKKAMDKLVFKDYQTVVNATLAGMSVESFADIMKDWLAKARHPRWNRPYTDLVYQPMVEVLQLLRARGYKTYIVTGSGQDFVRAFAQKVFGIPPEQVIGSALKMRYAYDKKGKGIILRSPMLLLDDNFADKPEDIFLFVGRRPRAAFGNSTGDRQMLEYTHAGPGARLMMLVLHDDAKREYAYGPAQGLPNSKVGTFTQALYDEAVNQGWLVISMKKDWKRMFAFE